MSHTAIAVVNCRCRRFINAADVWTRVDFAVKHHPYISWRLARTMTEHTPQIRKDEQVCYVRSVRFRGPRLLEGFTDETSHYIWHHADKFFWN